MRFTILHDQIIQSNISKLYGGRSIFFICIELLSSLLLVSWRCVKNRYSKSERQNSNIKKKQ